MSLFTDASLVYVPSGVKDGKTYSITPTDGSGDLTFSRGSDIEATRISADGLIHKAQVNLLLQSNTFSTTWASSSTTETGGQAGYDGTSDAWLLDKSAASGNVNQNISVSGVNTFSVYVKAGSESWVALLAAGPNAGKFFNLSAGTIGTNLVNAPLDASIESVGGGWYRISITTNGSVTQVRIYPAEGDGVSSGTSGNIYIQDAQLNYGLVAQTYQETTTAAVVSGITDNMPRLNYDPANPTCPSLLLEPSRQNEMPNSEYLAGWSVFNNIAITQNQTTSPEGVTNGVLMARTGSGDSSGAVRYSGISTTVNSKCFSVFAKANAHNFIQLYHSGDAQGYVNFDLSTGAVGTSGSKASGTIESYGSGWYRCTAIYDNTNAFGSGYWIGFAASASAGYAGGAVPDTASVYLYGAQIESSASYSSSYVPTYGSSATRTAEKGQKTSISALFGATATTLFLDFVKKENALGWTITGGNGTKLFSLCQFDASNPTKPRIVFEDGVDTGGTLPAISNGRHKLAVSYSTNDTRVYIDGTLVLTDTSCTYYQWDRIGVNATSWTGFTNNTNAFEINQFLMIPSATSNADLATLTSL